MKAMLDEWLPHTRSLLRVVVGFLFLEHGVQKLFGLLGGHQVADLVSQLGLAGILEFGGGLLILLGLFTRPVAFILSGQMAVAYFQRHAPGGFWPIVNKGELAALYCFLFLYFVFAGPGKWSLDYLIFGRTKAIPRESPSSA